MDFNKKLISFTFVFFCTLMTGCSSSDSATPSTAIATPTNVAATSNGGTASSTFSGNETFTIDDDTSSTNFWIGGADGDEVKVAFDKSYSVSEIIIHTNNTNFTVSGGGATTTAGVRVQLSNDDITYTEVAIAFGLNAPISCSSLVLGSGTIVCSLTTATDSKFIKLIVTSDFAITEIYEIEVTGV